MAVRGMFACAAMLLFAAPARAEEPICADRPGQSTPPCTVPAGHVQIETSLVDWSRTKSGGSRETSLAIADSVVKYGLTGRSDIQLGVTPWTRVTSRDGDVRERVSGFGDLVLGYKLRLTGDGAPVEVAARPFVKIPTAKRPLGNREWEGGLALPVGIAIGGSPLGVTLTPELDWVADGDGDGHHLAMVQVVSLGWQATERLNLSAGLLGQWDWDPAGTVRQYSTDASIAYLVKDSLQLDVGVNLGLNRTAPDLQISAGVSKRF